MTATDATFAIRFVRSVASTSAGSVGFQLASVKPTAVGKASRQTLDFRGIPSPIRANSCRRVPADEFLGIRAGAE